MAKGEKLRQIHLHNVCRSLITTDVISAKQVYKYKRRLCAFSPFHKRAFGCTEFKEALQLFYLKYLGDARGVSSTGANVDVSHRDGTVCLPQQMVLIRINEKKLLSRRQRFTGITLTVCACDRSGEGR